ncbi:MAG TPA: ATP-binding protein [Patescibacteria group bacterium]|nr:ATP-binding protein [Patescibacteria group bacterium]
MAELKPRQLIAVFLFIVIGIMLVGYSYYDNQKRNFIKKQHDELTVIADLKRAQIMDWRQDQVNILRFISRDPFIAQNIAQMLARQEQPENAAKLQVWLAAIKEYGFECVYLFDANGQATAYASDQPFRMNAALETSALTAINEKTEIFSLLYYDEQAGGVRLVMAMPILSVGQSAPCVGAVSVIINPYRELYPLVQSWPTPSDTAELLLVRREGDTVLFLNELRHRKDTALKLRLSIADEDLPASRASRGEVGVFEGIDYRGVPVLADTRPIPGSPWFLVAKIDAAEVFAPLQQQVGITVTMMAALIVLAGGLSYAFFFYNEAENRKYAEQEVRRRNELLEQKVRERTLQLEAAVTNLEIANKDLETFNYSVSHDLSTPLRGIDGLSQALLEDYQAGLDEQGQDYLRRIRAATQKMGQLIDDLLQLSRLTLSPMNCSQVNLSEVVESIIAELREIYPSHPVNAVVVPGITAYGDSGLLRVALYNLLGNAWKFTEKTQNPRVEFGVIEQAEVRHFFVRDNGVGFDMKYYDKLFNPFQRLHTTKEFAGTGIGLATVKRIIRRHGGEVGAVSSPEKTVFYFTLKGEG